MKGNMTGKGDKGYTIVEVETNMDREKNNLASFTSPSTGKMVDVTDVDIAMKYAEDANKLEMDSATNRRILRKIDICLLPLMCCLYAFQFIDKTTNSMASIMGMREDLNMTGNRYSWTGTAFYIGYLAFEFPASALLQRFPVAKTVSAFIIIWGLILCLHSVPQYTGFIALRTLLGMFESAITPAFVILTSQWYRREEQFIRTTLWFSCNGLGTIIGSGALAYNLAQNSTSYSIEAWKLVFIITGCLTITLGFIILFHIPDEPTKAWFLSEEEKKLVVERIRSNQQGFGNSHFKKEQFVEAITDIQTWLIVIYSIANNIPNGGVTNFSSILIMSMGYTSSSSLLMQMPQGAVMTVGCILMACGVFIYPYRLFWGGFGNVVCLIGSCMLSFCRLTKAQYAGFCLWSFGPIGFICVLSIIASNVAGHTKKVSTNAINLVAYCVGNLIGPQTFIDSQAPDYSGAKISIVVCQTVAIVALAAIWYVYWTRNKKIESNQKLTIAKAHLEFADLTDKENPNFKYSL